MEALLLYLIKSCGLLALFFLVYHFLLRKDTFFNTSRWFLMAGLFISVLLPLFFIKKVVLIEKPKLTLDHLMAMSAPIENTNEIAVAEPLDWLEISTYAYMLIAALILINVITNLVSLFRLLHKQEVIRREKFALVDLNKDVAPFSFFHYIVYNSRLYTNTELESILNHEKVHSEQKHTFDILIAKIFCIVFWFNPFVWLYKKAIAQNLEYIADKKAVHRMNDKKAYQIALLKVVANKNCLSITNNFYQSLIKKRIVMLNKNQSKKSNLWKYAFIFPLLMAFMLYFQIKVVAQEKQQSIIESTLIADDSFTFVINKNSSDAQIKEEVARLKSYGATLKISKVKRNSKGEITGIKIVYKDKTSAIQKHIDGTEPISPIHFSKNDKFTGFGNPSPTAVTIIQRSDDNEGEEDDENHFSFSFNDDEAPEAPEAPEQPEAPEAPELPETGEDSNIIVKSWTNANGLPTVIINGKAIATVDVENVLADLDPLTIDNINMFKGDKAKAYGFTSKDGVMVISTKDIKKISKDTLYYKRLPSIQMKKSRKDMERARAEIRRARPQMEIARRQIELSKPEMQKAAEEMRKAKEEMLQAKAEMEKMKAEFEQQKAEMEKERAARK